MLRAINIVVLLCLLSNPIIASDYHDTYGQTSYCHDGAASVHKLYIEVGAEPTSDPEWVLPAMVNYAAMSANELEENESLGEARCRWLIASKLCGFVCSDTPDCNTLKEMLGGTFWGGAGYLATGSPEVGLACTIVSPGVNYFASKGARRACGC